MKCIICDGQTQKKIVEDKEFGVSLGKFPAEVCQKCGEVYFDSETARKIQAKSKKLGLFGLLKKTKVAEVGNSLAIRIPKQIANFAGLKKNVEVTITPQNRHAILVEA